MRKIKLLFAAALSMIAWTGVMAQTDADIAQIDAANAAIGTNNVYRIYTLSNGSITGTTKYYLKADGYLTDQVEEAKSFAFELAAGGSYVKGKGYRLNKFTNGGDGSNNITNDAKTHIIVGTNDRDDFEGQVFFLNEEGNYAIRSTNANSTGWAAAAFWTVTTPIGEATIPNATYTMAGPQYIWLLEKDEPASQKFAASNTVKAWPVYVQSAAGLVKDASKFYSNAKESSEGSYEALVDGDYSTFFHSAWSAGSAVDEDHYLQAELSEATQKFEFYFKKRQQNNNNRPTTIVISASNDGENFTEITTLDSGFPTDEAVIDYFSDEVDLGAAYKYVRFTVTATNNGATNGNTETPRIFFTFSEFYMFPEAAAQLSSIYNNYATKSWTDITEDDITQINTADRALKSAISTVTVTYVLTDGAGSVIETKNVVQKPYSDVEIPAAWASNSKFFDYVANGTIGDTDCTITVVRSLKAGYVGTLADLSNSKAYFITCDRGKLLTSEGYLASTALSTLSSEEPSTFAILNYEDNYYLYSVADSKFVHITAHPSTAGKYVGALVGDLVADGFKGEADALKMTPKDVPYFMFYFTKDGTNYGLNTNSDSFKGYIIDTWMNADPGNQYYMVEAADFDPTAALAALEAYFNPAYTVTYVVKDEFGNTIFTSAPQPTTDGAVISNLPAEYKRTFYTYNEDEVEVTITDLATTVEFTATWNGPFELSADFASAHWYNMSMRGTWYVTTDVKDGDGAYKTQNANTVGLGEDSYQWAFTGNGYDGIKILNKAEGEGKSFGWTDAQQTNAGIPTVMDDAEGNHGWKIVASTNTSVPAGPFCLNVPGTNLYINQYGGAGGSVKFWDSGNNVGDPGSAFNVYEVPTDFSEYVVNEVAPALEATGYFTFTDAAKAAIGYDPAFKESCSFADFKSMKQKMAAAMEDISNFVLPETGFYTLKNKNYNTFMGIDPSDANLYGNYKTAVAAKQIVKLTKKGNGTYTIGLMGKYAPATVAQSAQVTAAAEAGTYTVVISTPGYAAFQADTENNMSCLHCASGGSVVGWEAPADASQWAVTDATGIQLTVEEAGYATAYLPFPIEIGKTISVPAAKGTWTFDDGTTGSLSATNGVVVADGVATVPVGDNLSVAHGFTDPGNYTFMMDIKVANEDKGRFTSLFMSGNDREDGGLFIYNHKTNGRRIGINLGGMDYAGSIELDTWYRIVFSCENYVPTVYVNGEKVAAASQAVNPTRLHWTLSDVIYFFADNDGEENEIKADEIRLWDVALSEAEVKMLGATGTVVPEPQNAVAYTAKITDGAEGTTPGDYKFLTLTEVEGAIPALTAIIVKGEPAVYNFTILAPEPEEEVIPDGALGIYDDEVDGGNALVKGFAPEDIENDLKGTLEPIDAAGLYVLAKPEGKEVCFYEAVSGTIAAGKAYLELPSGTEIKGFLFPGDDPTGIVSFEKAIENGLIYNIAGQRQSKMQKGINIVNGKKVLF